MTFNKTCLALTFGVITLIGCGGGSEPAPDTTYEVIVPSPPQVAKIYSTNTAFAALKTDGTVVTWGGYGGDSSAVELTNVAEIYSNIEALESKCIW